MAASHGWQLLAMKRRQVLFTVFILSTEEEDLKLVEKERTWLS